MKLATTTGDFRAYTDTIEAMEYIYKAGFRYIVYDFHSDYVEKNGIFSKDWRKHIEDVKRKADSMQVQYVQAHAPMGDPIKNNEYRIPHIAAVKRCIESCAALGIKNLVVHSGYDRGVLKDEAFEKNKAERSAKQQDVKASSTANTKKLII